MLSSCVFAKIEISAEKVQYVVVKDTSEQFWCSLPPAASCRMLCFWGQSWRLCFGKQGGVCQNCDHFHVVGLGVFGPASLSALSIASSKLFLFCSVGVATEGLFSFSFGNGSRSSLLIEKVLTTG
jgi:hypothetical protein